MSRRAICPYHRRGIEPGNPHALQDHRRARGARAVARPLQAFAVLRADYQFQNTLTSTVAGAPALTTINGGTAFGTESVGGLPTTVFTFPQGSGLQLSPTTGVTGANAVYSIVLLVRFADVAGYNKYVDFKNGTSDSGLYVQDGRLDFFPAAETVTAPITANTYRQIVVTRDAMNVVTGYVDGAQAIQFTDTGLVGLIDASNALRFFVDDSTTGFGEASAGAVARLRVYDNALTGPEVAALGTPGVIGGFPVPATSPGLLLALAALVLGAGLVATRRG